jgi:hypothetical protein
MARHHRHAVQPAAAAGAATLPEAAAPEGGEGAAAALSSKWRVALTVWALGFGGLMLYELVRFVVRAIRAAAN